MSDELPDKRAQFTVEIVCPKCGQKGPAIWEENALPKLTGTVPKEVYVDLGYRGHGLTDDQTQVILARQKRNITPTKKRRQKRRNAIEPIIGHCKNDRKVGPRNWLHGKRGDQINALAMAIGFNLRKILRWILSCLLFSLFFGQQSRTNQSLPA